MAEEIHLQFEGTDFQKIQLLFLTNILATQTASIDVLIDMLARDEPEALDFKAKFDQAFTKQQRAIHDAIFEMQGKVDFDSLLGG